jgi:hypothetical protein
MTTTTETTSENEKIFQGFFAPPWLYALIEQASASACSTKASFLRAAVLRDLKREGWLTSPDGASSARCSCGAELPHSHLVSGGRP